MRLRDYQQACHDAVLREWGNGVKSTLIVIPTGAGKTVVMAHLIKSLLPKRSMLIAHREELLFQACDKIQRAVGVDCEIEKADLVASTTLWNRTPCVVASLQTLCSGPKENRRYRRFKPIDFDCLLFDEAHHCPASTYRETEKYFRDGNPEIKIFGCTATPDRASEESLGQIFETVAFDYEILDAINDGWLVPVEQQLVGTTIDWSGIRTTAGDLNGADLSAVMEAEDSLQQVAGATIQIAGNRRTLVFAASVKQAEMLCNIFNRHKPSCAEWVCGATPRDQRRELLGRFERGDTQIMVNCAVLTEGFDCPPVEIIVMARPTKSRSLYSQMVGRATRPLDGLVDRINSAGGRKLAIALSVKPSCLVIDFVGNSGKHKLMTTADILGGNVSEEAVERAEKRAKEEGNAVNMKQLLEEEEKKLREEQERRRLAEEARKNKVVAKVSFSTTLINPFDTFDMTPVKARGWDNNRELSEKQRNLLRKQGVDPDVLNYAQGRQVLNELFRRWNGNLATMKQCKVVKKHFPELDVKTLTAKEATRLIGQLAANGWKRPQEIAA